jgi:ABC-type nitrate/sulfonate/bicarbonate transport system substrate-binding protein
MKAQTHGVAFTTQTVIDRKGPAVQAFIRAIGKAEETIHGDPTKVTELFKQYQKTLNPKAITALIPILQAEMPEQPTPQADGYAKAAAFHQESGLIASPPAFGAIVPESFIRQALSSGAATPSP